MPRVPDDKLDQYLDANNVAPDIANELRARYDEALATGGAYTWSDTQTFRWLDDQLETMTGETPRRPASRIGGAFGEVAGTSATDDDRLAAAEAAADDSVQRSQRTRDRFYRAADMFFDSGPAMDPNALATSIAVGVFTDAAGNPKIDPDTGAPMEVNAQTLWDAIRSQTFDMGELSMPRPRGRRPQRARAGREGADDARLARIEAISSERRRFVTPSMAMALLGSMPEDYLTHLQQQLWEAGLFGDQPPSWGVADDATRRAYMALFAEAGLTPNETIDRVLARMTDEAVTRGVEGAGQGQGDIPAFKPEVASKETLSKMIDDIAGDLMGRFATDEEKSTLIAKLQGQELENQRAQYDRDVAGLSGGPGQLDAFMAAISAQESGGSYTAQNAGSGAYGKFQIMPSNWGPWAERAGLGRSAPRTAENQEIVARHIMSDYYRQFGNWRDVAIAWFAGPGAVGKAGAENRSDGNLSVREYADRAVQRMAELGAGGDVTATSAGVAPLETFDPAAEAEAALKAADPAGWMGHQFASRATEFYQLLAGVT